MNITGNTIGRYTLEQRIATGGMATVFSASMSGVRGFRKPLCIKCILSDLSHDDDLVAMFVNEARILAELLHPNIVQVYDFGKENGTYYLVMEYVDGSDLSRLTDARSAKDMGPWPMSFSANVARSVLQALDYAHRFKWQGTPLNIIHRDVSPQNILVARDGFVKLTDFGVAKIHEAWGYRTSVGRIKGKFSYMSPEQMKGKGLDQTSDLFSLGVVLHEMVSGERFFGDGSVPTIINKANDMTKPTPIETGECCSKDFADFVLKLLAWNPAERFLSARAALEHLEALHIQHCHEPGARKAIEPLMEKETGTLLLPTRTIEGALKAQSEPSVISAKSNSVATAVVGASSMEQDSEHAQGRDAINVKTVSGGITQKSGVKVMKDGKSFVLSLRSGSGPVIISAAIILCLLAVFSILFMNGIKGHSNDTRSTKINSATLLHASPEDDDQIVRTSAETGYNSHVQGKDTINAGRDAETEPDLSPVSSIDKAAAGEKEAAETVKAQKNVRSIKPRRVSSVRNPASSGQPVPAGHERNKTGIINIFSKPWSEVWIDGNKAGVTPLKDYELHAGRHMVELINEPGRMRRKVRIRVRENETARIFEDLTKPAGKTGNQVGKNKK